MAYRRALELTTNGPERVFLTGRLDGVQASMDRPANAPR